MTPRTGNARLQKWLIYKQSYLTIAATSAPDGNAGILAAAETLPTLGRVLTPRPNASGLLDIGAVFVRRRPQHLPYSQTSHNHGLPLLTRAWVYQERFLSPRVVHYAAEELVWECEEDFYCECGSVKHDSMHSGTVKQGHFTTFGIGRWSMGSKQMNSSKMEKAIRDQFRKHPHAMKLKFRGAVSEYGQLNLTFTKDKFPAIAGIARQLHDPARGRYLAGLWEDTLAQDLQWVATSLTEPPQSSIIGDISGDMMQFGLNGFSAFFRKYEEPHPSRAKNPAPSSMRKSRIRQSLEKRPNSESSMFIAPSFSWASVQRASYELIPNKVEASTSMYLVEAPTFTYIAGSIKPYGVDEFGACESGFLVLHGSLLGVRVRLVKSAKGESEAEENIWETVADMGNAELYLDFKMDRSDFNTRGWQEEPTSDQASTVIGESSKLYYCFSLTQSFALLLEKISTSAGVYKRVGLLVNCHRDSFKAQTKTTIKLI